MVNKLVSYIQKTNWLLPLQSNILLEQILWFKDFQFCRTNFQGQGLQLPRKLEVLQNLFQSMVIGYACLTNQIP